MESSAYPLGYRFQQSPFTLKSYHIVTVMSASFNHVQGPFTVPIKASQSPKLHPFYTMSKLNMFWIQNDGVAYSVRLHIISVNSTSNQTTFRIIVYVSECSSPSYVNVEIMFFSDELQSFLISGYADLYVSVGFPGVSGVVLNLLLIDLKGIFSDPLFSLGPSYSDYTIQGMTVGIDYLHTNGCVDKGMMISFGMFDDYNIQVNFVYDVTVCDAPPQLYGYSLTFMIYNNSYLQQSQFRILTAYHLYTLPGSNVYFQYYSDATNVSFPLPSFICGINSLYTTASGNMFGVALTSSFTDGTQTKIVNQVENTLGIPTTITEAMIFIFVEVICPLGKLYDPVTNQCIMNCIFRRFIDPSVVIYNTNQCLDCMYFCKTCSSLTTCDTCDAINDFRQFDPITQTCIPLIGYYDDGYGNPIASPCDSICRQCVSLSALCISCFSGFQMINNTCFFIGCLNPLFISGSWTCLACDVSNRFIFSNGVCKCDSGFVEVNLSGTGSPNYCKSVCGDGVLIQPDEQCDDGNSLEYDGCFQCLPESSFVCSLTSPSRCVLHMNFYLFQYNYAYKIQGQNKAILSYTIQPTHLSLQNINWKRIISLNINSYININSLTFDYSLQTGELKLSFSYIKQLQNQILQTSVNFDSNLIVSNPTSYTLKNKLNGVNAPLIFQEQQLLKAYQTTIWISEILMIFIILQYVIGSYFHKMVGLQTLQIVQCFYFGKMLVSSKSTSLLNSLNNLKLSSNGYTNSSLIFGVSVGEGDLAMQKFSTVDEPFLRVQLEKYFLLNVNFFILPLLITFIVYFVYLIRKYRLRDRYMRCRDKHVKDQYTLLKRSTQWIYDHMVFPLTMMLNMISFFNFILYLESAVSSQASFTFSNSLSNLISLSFCIHLCVIFLTFFIYCFQIFYSYEQQYLSKLTSEEKQKIVSFIEKLQHDDNSPDQPNYHPMYVLVYLVYILMMQLAMVCGVLIKQIDLSLEIVLFISTVYLFIVVCWKPYHKIIDKHNKILTMNHFILLLFIIMCYLFQKTNKLSPLICITMVSVMLSLLGAVMTGGYLRIFIEKGFRKWLQDNSSALRRKAQSKQVKGQGNDKKQMLLMKNQYLFQNQLKQLGQKYGLKHGNGEDDNISLNSEEEQYIVHMIKEQIKLKNFLGQNPNPFQVRNNFQNNDLNVNRIGKFNGIELNSGSIYRNNTQQTLKHLKLNLRREWRQIHEENKPYASNK